MKRKYPRDSMTIYLLQILETYSSDSSTVCDLVTFLFVRYEGGLAGPIRFLDNLKQNIGYNKEPYSFNIYIKMHS